MIRKFLRVLPCLLAFHGLVAGSAPEVHVVGTGPDVSYVVIQETTLSAAPLIFAYHYTFATSPPLTGFGLISEISAAYPDLQIATTQYSFGKSLDAFDIRGATVPASTASDGNSGTYWSYYVSGGYDGAGMIGSNSWGYSQYGFEGRTIVPGSCDGWTFARWEGTNEPSDIPPSVAVADIASLVATATAPPSPTPSPTPVPTPDTTNPLAISVGAGPDVSFVVVQSEGLSSRPLVFAFHYTNSASPPMTGYGMLVAIRNAVPEFDFATTQYSFGKSLDAFRFQGTTVTSSTSPDGNSGLYWSYYLCGGYDGSGAVVTNGWSYSQYGFESRTITPGSCDGWTLASWEGTNGTDLPPTVDPTFLTGLMSPTIVSPGGLPTPSPVRSATPTPTPSLFPQPSPSPTGVTTPSQTPSSVGTNGGGAFYGGPIPADVPRGVGSDASRSDLTPGNVSGREVGNEVDPRGTSASSESSRSFSSADSAFLAVIGGGAYAQPEWFHPGGFVEPAGNSSEGPRAEVHPEATVSPDLPTSGKGLLSSYRQAVSGAEPLTSLRETSSDGGRRIPPEKPSQNIASQVWNKLTGHITKTWHAISQWIRSIPPRLSLA